MRTYKIHTLLSTYYSRKNRTSRISRKPSGHPGWAFENGLKNDDGVHRQESNEIARKEPRACTNDPRERRQILKFSLSSTRESSERCSESRRGSVAPVKEAEGAVETGGERFFGHEAWHPSKEEGKLDDCSVQLRWRLALGR